MNVWRLIAPLTFFLVLGSVTQAWAIEHDIVIDIEGLLIDKIPASLAKGQDPSTVIQVRGTTFKISDHALDLIKQLAKNPENKISFLSYRSKDHMNEILSALSKARNSDPDLGALASKMISVESLTEYRDGGKPDDEFIGKKPQIDLTKINADLKKVVLITDYSRAVVPGQENNLFYINHPQFVFSSFSDSVKQAATQQKENAERFSHEKKFYPTSEEEWRQHQNRAAGIFSTLLTAIQAVDGHPERSLAEATRDAAKRPLNLRIESGLDELGTHLAWNVVKGVVKGCREISDKSGKSIRVAHNEECAAALSVSYKWGGKKGNVCEAYTDKNAAIGSVDASLCIKNLGANYLWIDRELRTCGAFTKSYVFIAKTEKDFCRTADIFAKCKNDVAILTQITRNAIGEVLYKIIPNTTQAKDDAIKESCNQEFRPVTANDSPSLAYFKDLAKEGMSAPIEKFLKLWYPNRKPASDKEPFFFSCQDRPYGDFKLVNDEIPEDCKPEVLYSWGPYEKVKELENQMKDGQTWQGKPNPGGTSNYGTLFLTVDPSSTFGYGRVQVRVKVKSGTRFKHVSFGGAGSAIGYRTGSYQDFTVADSSVIESWSYGTPEQYDEIVRDIQKLSSGERAIRYVQGEPSGSGINRVLETPDHVSNGTVEYLKANLLTQIKMILNGEGRIYYNEGACRNRTKAFHNQKPTYFSP